MLCAAARQPGRRADEVLELTGLRDAAQGRDGAFDFVLDVR